MLSKDSEGFLSCLTVKAAAVKALFPPVSQDSLISLSQSSDSTHNVEF